MDNPTVTFSVAGHHCPMTGYKLHCLLTEAHSEMVGSWTRDLYVTNPDPNVYTTRPHHINKWMPSQRLTSSWQTVCSH